MKKNFLLFVLLICSVLVFGQVKFNTGSVEFDQDLGIINANAKFDLKTFKLNTSVSHNLPIPKIEELLKIMEPAEIILAKDVADAVNKPIDTVVASYKINKDKGWGVIAKEMGIKPGSPEFHALRGKTKKNKDTHGKLGEKGHGKEKEKSGGKGKAKKK